MTLFDPHSHWDHDQARVRHLDLELVVEFEHRRLGGRATVHLSRPAEGVIDLDSRGLEIESIQDPAGNACRFELGSEDSILGRRLRVFTKADRFTIRYAAGRDASALQWLSPAQTAGGEKPFVYTQCQAIHARSIIPCQDSPGVRVTYRAEIEVDAGSQVVMAAAPVAKSMRAGRHQATFEMKQPVPPYLFAFAAGDLVRQELGRRSAVYAEPSQLSAAAAEFVDVEAMIREAERLFGPYDWERFDILLMPPSFPYGGMENPRLTFVTPTLITGDRSLVSVIAHELAHSWTGNLITNANLEHFWLNEGFTVYAERRILEVLEGPERAELHAALGYAGLRDDIERFGADSPLTQLNPPLTGEDPDEVFSLVPYEKGYLFLRRIEEVAGRQAFDRFLKAYIKTFRFQSILTDDFSRLLKDQIPGIEAKVDLGRWIHAPGLPPDVPTPKSSRLEVIRAAARQLASGKRDDDAFRKYSPLDWQLMIESLPKKLPKETLEALDRGYHLSESSNAEIRVGFQTRAAHSGLESCFGAIEDTLMHVGRMKYIKPLYAGLLASGPKGQARAKEIFARAKSHYHPLAARVLEGLLA